MWLDDCWSRLRSAGAAGRTGISCSIDPSDEGIVRLRGLVPQLVQGGIEGPQAKPTIEETLGLQKISVTGVPGDSHFARVIVAADYRMKRLAMDFEAAPIAGLPSFLKMMTAAGPACKTCCRGGGWNRTTRPCWPRPTAWLGVPRRQRQGGDREEFVTHRRARADRQGDPVAQKWADNMTAHYDELAAKDAVFGQLRNCIDLAVVVGVDRERSPGGKGHLQFVGVPARRAVARRTVQCAQASRFAGQPAQKGQNWLISCSGGVLINSWKLADKPETATALAPVRDKAAPSGENWRWN